MRPGREPFPSGIREPSHRVTANSVSRLRSTRADNTPFDPGHGATRAIYFSWNGINSNPDFSASDRPAPLPSVKRRAPPIAERCRTDDPQASGSQRPGGHACGRRRSLMAQLHADRPMARWSGLQILIRSCAPGFAASSRPTDFAWLPKAPPSTTSPRCLQMRIVRNS